MIGLGIVTGKFDDYKNHHEGNLRAFRFYGGVELWAWSHYATIQWRA